MVVQHNITAINANRYYGINNNKLAKSLEKLSSGYAINRAGDNAAGLAVSEKMRSQIAGINQGVKNAQDGISMIQTFEGALTETDSILQRMKVLADQSANGTYQNEVDRDAIQLEFNQLNDELNQIADTDFNGVVVLNGGQMSDGLKQVDGKFDYSLKAGQIKAENDKLLSDAQTKAQAAIDKAQKNYNNAKLVYDAAGPRDLSNNGNALQWGEVDNNKYDTRDSSILFNNLKKGTDTLEDLDVDEVNVTFTYDETSKTWKATRAFYTDDMGKEQDAEGLSDVLQTAAGTYKGNSNGKVNGGFDIMFKDNTLENKDQTNTSDPGRVLASAKIDASNVKDGDTVTLKFTNSVEGKVAPDEIVFQENSVTNSSDADIDKMKVTLASGINSGTMNSSIKKALEQLDNAEFSFSYKGSAVQNIQIENGGDLTVDSTLTDGKFNIYYLDENGNNALLASVTPASGHEKNTSTVTAAPADIAGTDAAGKDVDVTKDSLTLQWNGEKWIDLGTNKEVADGIVIGKDTDGTTDLTFDANDWATNDANLSDSAKWNVGDKITVNFAAKDVDTTNPSKDGIGASVTYDYAEATSGSVRFKLSTSYSEYSDSAMGPTVKVSKDTAITSDTISIDKNYADSKAALEAAKAAYPKTLADLGIKEGVSKSDAFDQATAPLTYQDHIMLQAGARTKDLVDFTFKYESQGLGDLKADLDCSARGLGTDKLSLATQEEANYAIDRIDNAINKTNMVRATFGAVQNRLEHKIDNLNVTSENLTSAESRIRDTNMAEEMMAFTKNQILAQASQSMLAQANQLPQGVLSLLQ